jgi:hypothetical protein
MLHKSQNIRLTTYVISQGGMLTVHPALWYTQVSVSVQFSDLYFLQYLLDGPLFTIYTSSYFGQITLKRAYHDLSPLLRNKDFNYCL